MQRVSSERMTPMRLICSGCRYWEHMTFQTSADAESAGRCGRFGETRLASARPRCNICWEPSSSPIDATAPADG